jgi:hypothetical protein
LSAVTPRRLSFTPCRAAQTRQLQKPVVHRFRVEHSNHEAGAAIQKTAPQQIGPHERPRAAPKRLAEAAALTRRVTLLRARRRIRIELAQHAFEVLVRVVHQLAGQTLRGGVEHEALVHEVVGETRGAAFEQTRNPVRVPAAVMNPVAAKTRQPVHRVDVGGGGDERRAHCHSQFRRDDFVGVDR